MGVVTGASIRERSKLEAIRQEMSRLRGRLFELVDAAHLASEQAHGLKGAIRHTTYDLQRELEAKARRDEI